MKKKKILALVLSLVLVMTIFVPVTEVSAAVKQNSAGKSWKSSFKSPNLHLGVGIMYNINNTGKGRTVKVVVCDKKGKELMDAKSFYLKKGHNTIAYRYGFKPNTDYSLWLIDGGDNKTRINIQSLQYGAQAASKNPNTKAKAAKLLHNTKNDFRVIQGEEQLWYKIPLERQMRFSVWLNNSSVNSGKVLISLKNSAGKTLYKETFTPKPFEKGEITSKIFDNISLAKGTYYVNVQGMTSKTNAVLSLFYR